MKFKLHSQSALQMKFELVIIPSDWLQIKVQRMLQDRELLLQLQKPLLPVFLRNHFPENGGVMAPF